MSHSLGVVIGYVLVAAAIVLAVISVKLGTTKTTRTALGVVVSRKWGLSKVQAFVLSVLWLFCLAGYTFVLAQNAMRNLEQGGIVPWMFGLLFMLLCGMILWVHTGKGKENLNMPCQAKQDPC
jgi:glycerol uptake facilitator-like aquaporin